MACNDTTPWSITNHPHTIIRKRPTGGESSQSTGEWTQESTSDTTICGTLRQVSKTKPQKELRMLDGAQFMEGSMLFICNGDCDVAINDILEVYEDEAGVEKTCWRVTQDVRATRVYNNINATKMKYWMIVREERE